MPTPHHRPRNVPLTNNLTAGGDAGARKEGRYVRFMFPIKHSHWSHVRDDHAKPHETSEQAARRALKRLIAAGLVNPVVVKPAPRSTWNPRRPLKKAPHWKVRNVKLSNGLARSHLDKSTATGMNEEGWKALKRAFPERFPGRKRTGHAAFKLASRALKQMQTAARKAAA